MEAYILVAYVFWGLAFGWAIYAMLVALGLARPLMNWITKHVWRGITGPIRQYPILFTVLGYVGGLGLLIWIFHEPLGLFDNVAVTGLEDRRSLGLGFAGITAPLLAIIGYILSANRMAAMEEDNHIKKEDAKRRVFNEKIAALDDGGVTAIAAIFYIKESALADETYKDEALVALFQFVRHKTQFVDQNTNRRVDPKKSALAIAETLIAISLLHKRYPPEPEQTNFHDGDFSEILFPQRIELVCLTFYDCNFNNTFFSFVAFDKVRFFGCSFKRAMIAESNFASSKDRWCKFLKVDFGTLDISNSNFETVIMKGVTGLECARYEKISPPFNLPVGTKLPTPFENSEFMIFEDAEKFWSTPGNNGYRPRDRDGNLIEIVRQQNEENTDA